MNQIQPVNKQQEKHMIKIYFLYQTDKSETRELRQRNIGPYFNKE